MSARTVTIVASELLGRPGTGGAGTADSLLAVALARKGHRVRLLIASGRDVGDLNDTWRRAYDEAGVEIEVLERRTDVTPVYLAPPFEVYEALRRRPPDVVVADDWRGLAFSALQARETRLAFDDTAFVIQCHGPGRVLTAFAQKVPDTLERFGESVAERAAIGLADAVVSPSAWLLGWMREHVWPVPDDAQVIQYLRQSIALEQEPPAPAPRGPVRRIAFFGQVREGKGVRLFVDALRSLDPRLLAGVDVLFLGSARGRWTPETIAPALPPDVTAQFETELDRDAALAELRTPGTLAVMPSLLDNSPNTVAECIEQGVPFVATDVGGVAELVAEADRARVLCAPTAADLARTLKRALDGEFAPASPARAPEDALADWLRVVDTVQPRGRRQEPNDDEFVLRIDESIEADDDLESTLRTAQRTSGADVVTTAVRDANGATQLFLGDPGALGLAENQYGTVALIRRSLARDEPIWPLLARLSLDGAKIVSVPRALATTSRKPGRADDVPGDGLAVLEVFEHAPPPKDLAQLAATLAATVGRSERQRTDANRTRLSRLLRGLR
jgi:glycosyltransferase involved in cell wall biosynthesis